MCHRACRIRDERNIFGDAEVLTAGKTLNSARGVLVVAIDPTSEAKSTFKSATSSSGWTAKT
jgi:hypothetical protein